MVTLTERTIMKSRSGVYSDTAENRRKHRVGQKYGAEKQPEDGEKTEKKEDDPAKELEAVNKVIAAISEGKLTLPIDQIMVLVEKKSKLEAAKKQAEKINAGVKANEEKKNAEEAKETSKKINEAQKEEEKPSLSKEKLESAKDGSSITIKNAQTKNTVISYTKKDGQWFSKNSMTRGEVKASPEQVSKTVEGYNRKTYLTKIDLVEETKSEPKQEASGQASEADKEDLREARKKLAYLQDNEERLIKRDGKEKYEERLKQAKDEVAKLKGEKPKEEKKPETKPEKTPSNEKDPAKELEAVDKVIAAINEGKLKLPQEEIMVLIEKKNNLELAKRQAEKIHSGVKANEEKRNAAEAKETSKKINEAQIQKIDSKKEEEKTEDGEYITHDKDKIKRYHLFRALKNARKTGAGASDSLKELGYLASSGINSKGKKKYAELFEEFGNKEYIYIDNSRKSEKKEEPKKEETEESYTRVKFEDVPNSGKVNLKKYLSEKVRQGVDEKWSNIKNIPTENLKKMEKGLVNDLNKNFEAIKKSQRAELLYSIMKVKGELESRGKETQKKE